MAMSEASEDDDSETEVKPPAKKRAPRKNVVKDSDEDVESEVDGRPITHAVAKTRQRAQKMDTSASIPTADSNGKAGMLRLSPLLGKWIESREEFCQREADILSP